MKINRRRLLSLLGTSPVLLTGSGAEAEAKKGGHRVLVARRSSRR